MININNKKGITLVILVITIIVLTIITGVAINGMSTSNEAARYNKMNADIKLLKDKILVYYNKYNEIPTTERNIEINGITYNEIDFSKLDSLTLNYGKDYGKNEELVDNESDVYVINDDMNIYYIKGVKMDGERLHNLENDVAKQNDKDELVEARLPAGYTELEYLESTGEQYIDTGIYLKTTPNILKIDFIADILIQSKDTAICGNNDKSTSRWVIGAYQNKIYVYSRDQTNNKLDDNLYSTEYSNGYKHCVVSVEYNILEKNKILSVNGEVYNGNYNVDNISNENEPILVFTSNRGKYPDWYIKMKLYRITFTIDNTVVWDGIPALDSDNNLCIYDTVSEAPFYNQGTGDDFTAGPAV